MLSPITLADLASYVNVQVDAIFAEEYNALSEETKRFVTRRDYWLLGPARKRMLARAICLDSGECKALIDDIAATRRGLEYA